MAGGSRPFGLYALVSFCVLILIAWIAVPYVNRWYAQRSVTHELISEHHWDSKDSSAVIDILNEEHRLGKLIGSKDIKARSLNGKININDCNGTTIFKRTTVLWWIGQKNGKPLKASLTIDVGDQVVTDYQCEKQ